MDDIKRANFRLIEKELYHYMDTCKRVAAWRSDILLETHAPDTSGVQSGMSDPTPAKALKLQTKVLKEITNRLDAIDWALERTKAHPDKGRWELVKLKYFDGKLTNDGIMHELSISKRTFYYWRREFVQLVADRLGWEI